ncbi:MAG: hypothetical protein WCK81_15080, partial [Betaproteobacteria bacterium]
MATLINQTNTTGTVEDDQITGTTGNDVLNGGQGNDSLTGGAGNDTIDGGSGMNTLVLSGQRLDYIIPSAINLNANGFTIRATTDAIAAGNTNGIDVAANIQKIVFAGETDPLFQTLILDDYSNAADPGNIQIEYGKIVQGIHNFANDTDWFRLATQAGQSVDVTFNGKAYVTQLSFSQGSSVGRSNNGGTYSSTMLQSGIQDITLNEGPNYWGNGWANNNGNPYSYSFVIRRNWTGTDAADSIHADGQFEHLMGGAGNDTLIGGAVSDIIEGGTGNDTLQGGGDNDTLDGGSGINTAIYTGNRADYDINFQGNATWQIIHRNNGIEGTDTVSNIQNLQFADQTVVLDDYSNAQDSNALLSTFGHVITGAAQYAGDSDWFQFDFGKLGIGKSLHITLEGGGGNQRVGIFDTDGNQLYFKNAAGQDVVWLYGGQNVLIPDRWGPNGEGGIFIGGKGWVQLYADSPQSAGTQYQLTIARYLEG